MRIRIKEYRRGEESIPVVRGFFPEPSLRMKPGDVYECYSQEQYDACIATQNVEPTAEPVTQSLLERKAVLEGEIERERDTTRTNDQAQQIAAQQAVFMQQAQENAALKGALEQMQERLEALEKPKRGRPRKEPESDAA